MNLQDELFSKGNALLTGIATIGVPDELRGTAIDIAPGTTPKTISVASVGKNHCELGYRVDGGPVHAFELPYDVLINGTAQDAIDTYQPVSF